MGVLGLSAKYGLPPHLRYAPALALSYSTKRPFPHETLKLNASSSRLQTHDEIEVAHVLHAIDARVSGIFR